LTGRYGYTIRAVREKTENDMEDGSGVNGKPAFFINDKRHSS